MKTPNESSSWGNNDSEQPSTGTSAQGVVQGGLARLFGLQSMVSDKRALSIVPEVKKELERIYKDVLSSTSNPIQREIIPHVDLLTGTISPQLPGLGLYMITGQTLYVFAALFSNSTITISSERLSVTAGNMGGWGGAVQQISVPLTPVQYINKPFIAELTKHYTMIAEEKNVKNVEILGSIVIDLEMLNHPEAGEAKDLPVYQAVFLANEWETSILARIPQELVAAKQPVPSPFVNPDSPYGSDGCAEARVTAIEKRVTRARTLSPANLEVTVSTINKNNSTNFSNSREVCRTQATVSLVAVPYEDHIRFIQQQQAAGNFGMLNQYMGMMAGGQAGYPQGYHPLRPTITIESTQAGEMMGNNGGLGAFLYGLFSLMVTNNQYVFMEALRRKQIGSRGNLAALEVRIEQMLRPIIAMVPNRENNKLDEKKIQDTDFVNNWIRLNVSPQATFQINLVPHGPDAALVHFLGHLAGNNRTKQTNVMVATIDGITKNKFSELVAENVKNGKGWNTSRPILIPTGILVANGLAEYAGQKLNTQELDEMAICHYKAKAPQAIESLLSIQYGTNSQNEDPKYRSSRLRTELAQSVYEHGVHINAFSQTFVWAPDFMAVFAAAMDSIGEMSAANNIGSFRSNMQAFQPGLGLATMVTAGANAGANNFTYFM